MRCKKDMIRRGVGGYLLSMLSNLPVTKDKKFIIDYDSK